jgi:hypothetical protein
MALPVLNSLLNRQRRSVKVRRRQQWRDFAARPRISEPPRKIKA